MLLAASCRTFPHFPNSRNQRNSLIARYGEMERLPTRHARGHLQLKDLGTRIHTEGTTSCQSRRNIDPEKLGYCAAELLAFGGGVTGTQNDIIMSGFLVNSHEPCCGGALGLSIAPC